VVKSLKTLEFYMIDQNKLAGILGSQIAGTATECMGVVGVQLHPSPVEITDAMRFSFIAASSMSVITDEKGSWACVSTALGNMPHTAVDDLGSSVDECDWYATPQAAIDAAILEDSSNG